LTRPANSEHDPEPEPCDTGDPVIDDPEIQQAFEQLWEESNFGSIENPNPERERVEQGGWIVQDPSTGNRSFVEFSSDWQRSTCQIKPPEGFTLPDNVVAVIHTHPFTTGEKMYSCLQVPESLIQQFKSKFDQIVKKYDNRPSSKDVSFLNDISDQTGISLIGYIFDQDGITKYNQNSVSNDSKTMSSHKRCGY